MHHLFMHVFAYLIAEQSNKDSFVYSTVLIVIFMALAGECDLLEVCLMLTLGLQAANDPIAPSRGIPRKDIEVFILFFS